MPFWRKSKPQESSEQASLPARNNIGVWQTDPKDPGTSIATLQLSDGNSYQISFKYDPSSGSFAHLLLQRKTPETGQTWLFPSVSLSDLSPTVTPEVLRALITATSDNLIPLESAIKKVVSNSTREFLDKNAFEQLLSSATLDQSIEWFKASKAVSLKDAHSLVKAIFAEKGPELLKRIFEVAAALSVVESSGRGKIALLLLRSFKGDNAKLNAHLCNIFLDREGPQLAQYLSKIEARDFEKLLRVAVDRHFNTTSGYGLGLVRALVAVPKEERTDLAASMARLVIKKGHPHLLYQSLPSSVEHRKRMDAYYGKEHFEALSGMPEDVTLFMAQTWPAKLLANRDLFSDISSEKIIDEALKHEVSDGMLEEVFQVQGIVSGALALRLLDEGRHTLVVDNLDHIQFSRRDYGASLRKIVEAGHLNIVFEKLNQIPEYALEVLEKGYYLQSYKKDIGITSEEVYQAYRKVQQKGDSLEVAKFVSDIQAMKRRIISAEAIPPQLFAHPLYPVIVKFVYPANQGHGELFQSAGTFPDRTSDLQAFKVRSSYTINTYEGSEMVIKEGSSVDAKARAQIEGPIVAAQERLGSVNFNIEEMRALLDKELAGEIKISRNFKTREERLLGSFLAAQKGDIPMDKVKRFLLMYQFTEYENIQDYLEGTRQKVEKTKHPDYAHLLELHEYYHDKVHDALQGLLDSLREQGRVQKFLPDFFEKFELRRRSEHRQDVVNRHRPVKLGWTDSLAMQIERIKAKEDQPGQKPKDEIIENIISKEKARIAAFVADLTGEELSVEAIDLKTFDAAHYLKLYEDEAKGPWNLDMIFSNVGQMFRTAFHDELRAIKSEMSKYIPEDAKPGAKRVLTGIISKNAASGQARGCGGVCVARDKEQWAQKNYLQMVLIDPDGPRCEGVLLMHYYVERGKKMLSVSWNPSSTYLYKVDEERLFEGLLGAVVEFATDNDIDYIMASTSTGIRSNRTGGGFERAMNNRIREVNRQMRLASPQKFSFSPSYSQQDFDVLWAKEY